MQDLDERIRNVLRQVVPDDYQSVAISEDRALHELGVSSLALVMLLIRFEDEFKVDLVDLVATRRKLDLLGLRTVKDVFTLGRALVKEARGPSPSE